MIGLCVDGVDYGVVVFGEFVGLDVFVDDYIVEEVEVGVFGCFFELFVD